MREKNESLSKNAKKNQSKKLNTKNAADGADANDPEYDPDLIG